MESDAGVAFLACTVKVVLHLQLRDANRVALATLRPHWANVS